MKLQSLEAVDEEIATLEGTAALLDDEDEDIVELVAGVNPIDSIQDQMHTSVVIIPRNAIQQDQKVELLDQKHLCEKREKDDKRIEEKGKKSRYKKRQYMTGNSEEEKKSGIDNGEGGTEVERRQRSEFGIIFIIDHLVGRIPRFAQLWDQIQRQTDSKQQKIERV